MISQKQIGELRESNAFDWINALKTGCIRKLVEGGALQLDLFDERNLFEFEHSDYPEERLVACRNPALAYRREKKRQSMLEATEKEPAKVVGMVERGTLKSQEEGGSQEMSTLQCIRSG